MPLPINLLNFFSLFCAFYPKRQIPPFFCRIHRSQRSVFPFEQPRITRREAFVTQKGGVRPPLGEGNTAYGASNGNRTRSISLGS